MEMEWKRLCRIGSQVKQGKLDLNPPKRILLTIQLVECNESKAKKVYTPVPDKWEKQYVQLCGSYTYENVYRSIWDHYQTQMPNNMSRPSHSMSILMSPTGPRASSTDELRGRKTFLICIEKKVSGTVRTTRERIPIPSITISNIEKSHVSIPPMEPLDPVKTNSPLPLCESATNVTINHGIKKSVMPIFRLTPDDLKMLGKKLPEIEWVPASIRSLIFDAATQGFVWSDWSDIRMNKGTLIGQGGFRDAFRCTIDGNSLMEDGVYVLKKFHSCAIIRRKENISELNKKCTEVEASLDLNMKAVQTLALARILSTLFKDKFGDKEIELPSYISSWLIKFSGGGYGTVEEYLGGNFTKYLNNSMDQSTFPVASESALKAIAYAHFTYEYNGGNLMVTDLQGVGLTLTDREVATKKCFEVTCGEGEMIFGAGNMPEALDYFRETHLISAILSVKWLS